MDFLFIFFWGGEVICLFCFLIIYRFAVVGGESLVSFEWNLGYVFFGVSGLFFVVL